MATKIQVQVDDRAAMGNRFVDAWHRAQAGEPVDDAHVTFLRFQAMTEKLSRAGWDNCVSCDGMVRQACANWLLHRGAIAGMCIWT